MILTLVLAQYATLLCACPNSWCAPAFHLSSPDETYLGDDCDPAKLAGHEQHRHRVCSRSSWENMLISSCENTTHTGRTTFFKIAVKNCSVGSGHLGHF